MTTQYKDRRHNIDVTGGPSIIQLDAPIGAIEVVATFKGLIFKEQHHDLKDIVLEQAVTVMNDDNTVLRRVSLPWVESHTTGFYAMPSNTTMRIPRGFGEGYPSKVTIVNPYKKLYEDVSMEFDPESNVLTLDTDAHISTEKSIYDLYFVYDTDVKRLKINAPGGKLFADFMNTAVGSTWFLPFLHYTTNVEEHKITVGWREDAVVVISEHEKDKHHIYVGHKNNYREFEAVDARMLLKHNVDGNVHYARKNDFIAALVSDKDTKIPKTVVVVNGGDERITAHYSKKEVIVHGMSTVLTLIDAPFGRPMPTVKDVIDMVVKAHGESEGVLHDYMSMSMDCNAEAGDENEYFASKEESKDKFKNFPSLKALFGGKGGK